MWKPVRFDSLPQDKASILKTRPTKWAWFFTLAQRAEYLLYRRYYVLTKTHEYH